MDIIDQTNREKVLYCIVLSSFFRCCFLCAFFWGYFGAGSGTHYMYSLGDDDDVMRFL